MVPLVLGASWKSRYASKSPLARSALSFRTASAPTSRQRAPVNSASASRAATASRELAEQQLQVEESKFEVGLSTNFFVLQSQRDLASAQDAELRAFLDYQRALIEFDRTQRASHGAAGIATVGGATRGWCGGRSARHGVGNVPVRRTLIRRTTY